MQRQCTVHSADALVVPAIALVPHVVRHLATAPTRLLVCQLAWLLHDRFICRSLCLVAIRTATDLHGATSLSFTQSKFLNCVPSQFPSFGYLESFFSIISFSTSCSKLRFAYICFKRRFSSSSSFIRFTSLTLIPPYFAFHL